MAKVELNAVSKSYARGTLALSEFSLAIRDGEFMVLVGPSGCGKSTVLRIVAGLETASAGRVIIGERDVTAASPRERDVAMVFQSYALYPHKTVRENIGFGMRMRGVARGELERRTLEVAAKLSLEALLDRKPAQLSGGQRQRVALGRALVRAPNVFLLDEPLSNLDAKLRTEMRGELARLHAAFGVTTLYVTHDQEEAMTLAERLCVLSEGGVIEQLGTPAEIYERPASVFVAEFIGTPGINWFQGRLAGAGGGAARVRLQAPGMELPLEDAGDLDALVGREVRAGIRPHEIALRDPDGSPLRARVELVELLGPTALVHARSEAEQAIRVLIPQSQLTGQVRRGEVVGLAPATTGVHLFDPGSGRRIG
jgi:multiple sugar transport system ATP-binding protein